MPPTPDKALWTAVDRYLNAHLLPPDLILDSALAANRSANLPSIDVAPNQGKFLNLLARIHGARRILEIGTLGGYSTIWLARALPPGGRLISLEFEPRHAEVARANIAHAGLADKVDIRVGPAAESLAQLHAQAAEPFDLIFIDADKDNYPTYLDWSLRLARPGTVILADNIVRSGDILDPAHPDPRVAGVRFFLEKISTNPLLETTAFQTVGSKGYDGFTLSLVLEESNR